MKKNNFTKIAFFVVVALVAALLLLLVLEKTHVTSIIKMPTQTPPGSPTNAELKRSAKADADNKQALIESPQTTPTATPSDQTIELTPKQEPDNSVTVLTKLKGYASGQCDLVVVNGQKTVSQSAKVIYQSDFSSCAGFSVPSSQLGAGNWQITLKVTSEGAVTSKTINYQVNL